MTFLGIGPGELFLVLIIALVVVGPERLPGFARQLGKWIVGLRNWIQSSPDAQLLLRARDELEEEFRTIRSDLAQEMQSVRDEMQSVREEMLQATREATLDATRQLDDVTAAAREAAAQIEQAGDAATDKIALTADDAVDEASAEIEQIAQQAAEQAAEEATGEVVADMSGQTGVSFEPGTDTAPQIPPAISSAVDTNGQTVPRSSRPGAPQPLAKSDDAAGPGLWIDAEAHSAARAEVETLKQQLSSVNDELRDLRALVQALRDELHPAASSGQQ